jgi:phosphoribosylformylglycinamidine synthase
LFGEASSRIVVTVAPERLADLMTAAGEASVPMLVLGQTGGDRFRIGELVDLTVSALADAWFGGLSEAVC